MCIVTIGNAVQVEFQNFIFGVTIFQLATEHVFFKLAADALFTGTDERIFGKLLRNC